MLVAVVADAVAAAVASLTAAPSPSNGRQRLLTKPMKHLLQSTRTSLRRALNMSSVEPLEMAKLKLPFEATAALYVSTSLAHNARLTAAASGSTCTVERASVASAQTKPGGGRGSIARVQRRGRLARRELPRSRSPKLRWRPHTAGGAHTGNVTATVAMAAVTTPTMKGDSLRRRAMPKRNVQMHAAVYKRAVANARASSTSG
mmetsp:Transcript_45004/g.105143  ORF Transcript_45004/g.105143 Transcript_45004/m.105143 type:complete len:203 (-) Transcript_45004:3-611(-)